MPFRDRNEAGRRLAARLERLRDKNLVVLGLPRGGVPVAAQVARVLGAPLDVIVVRKLGVPIQPELGMGAIGEGGVRVLNSDVLSMVRVSDEEIAAVEDRERAELDRRARRFRGERAPVPLRGRTAIVVDDGVATGSTARAACLVARAHGAARVILATPVAPRSAAISLARDADEVVCLEVPEQFLAIGEWYEDFSQTTDDEVVALLAEAAGTVQGPTARSLAGAQDSQAGGGGGRPRSATDAEVTLLADGVELPGHLAIPGPATGIVLFAHGSGSSRHSPRNRYVARVLTDAGVGTLLFDLLTPAEEDDRARVFDIGLLAARLAGATAWLRAQPVAAGRAVGYFGASTGAAAALWAAAQADSGVAAVVSRGGRPDLAMPRLAAVRSPTLLIVGGRDEAVLELNREAMAHMRCESELAVVPGATHLFEEPGALERVAALARDWFIHRLAPAHARA